MPTPGGLDAFREVWLVDAATAHPPGGRPEAACLAGREVRTGRTFRCWHDDLRGRREPPYPTGPHSLFVAYEAAEALACHLAMGWPMPARILDLAAEFRCLTAGLDRPHGAGLFGALSWHAADALGSLRHHSVTRMVLGGGPWSDAGRGAILGSCEARVEAIRRLFAVMAPTIDWPRALLRGRYMTAVARMEREGVPIDMTNLQRLREVWPAALDPLIRDIDRRFGVFDGRTFRPDRWAAWLERNRIPWPTAPDGRPDLGDDAFREVARRHPDVALMRELRVALDSRDPTAELAIGPDGRNRARLSPFHTVTGRNQLFGSVFGPAVWLRGLIRPEPGRAMAYIDWAHQEFGIAAALSGDPAMRAAYESGDPYLAFAVRAGQAPPGASPASHGAVRETFKACVLGVQYGMGAEALARRIGQPAAKGRELLGLHRETFPGFWEWCDGAEAHAQLLRRLHTVFGWTLHPGRDANPRSLRNFPMQANGAEMLRLACCLATERGVAVCVPIHDAVLVEGPADGIAEVVARTRAAMAEASEVVLTGLRLRTSARVVRWPERYLDERGRGLWDRVMRLLPISREADSEAPAPARRQSA
jgi:hypothetical protein